MLQKNHNSRPASSQLTLSLRNSNTCRGNTRRSGPKKAKVHLKENVKLQSGQMNNIIYIVRENSELVIDRITNDYGGFGIFDSKFICHPNSKVTVNFKNTGSDYYQENFYFDLTTNVDLTLNGRNNIYKGHEYHQFVHVDSRSSDNKSIIDINQVITI